jgi:hypothetical protein
VSFHLDSDAGQLSLSNADWYKATQLAYQYGFKPPRKNPTLVKLEPFTLSPKVAAALQEALRRALPELPEAPDPLYQLFEQALLGSNIPTVEATVHFAGKQALVERILMVLQGEVTVTYLADEAEPHTLMR